MSVLLPIHIAAGGLALVLGAVALVAKKGGPLHRRMGLIFVYAMIVMGISASILGRDARGWITVYFVVTAVMTVRPESRWTRWVHVAALAFVVWRMIVMILGGVIAYRSPGRVIDGVPYQMLFFLAVVLFLAAAGDLRVLRSGPPRGGKRLARHLWRMCFALFIAAGSFFSIRARVAKILPEPFTSVPMRALPIVLLFVAMFYWLWRVRGRRPLPVRHDALARGGGSGSWQLKPGARPAEGRGLQRHGTTVQLGELPDDRQA